MADTPIASAKFRVTYHSLTEPVAVTVLGRVIGRYIPSPFGRYWEPDDEGRLPEPGEEVHAVEENDEEIDYGRVRLLTGEECE